MKKILTVLIGIGFSQLVLLNTVAFAGECCIPVGEGGFNCSDGQVYDPNACPAGKTGECGAQAKEYVIKNIYKKGVIQINDRYSPDMPLPKGFKIVGNIKIDPPIEYVNDYNPSNTGSYGVALQYTDLSGKLVNGEASICARFDGDCKVADQSIGIATGGSFSGTIPCGGYADPFGEGRR